MIGRGPDDSAARPEHQLGRVPRKESAISAPERRTARRSRVGTLVPKSRGGALLA
jgi:hypothetical protein